MQCTIGSTNYFINVFQPVCDLSPIIKLNLTKNGIVTYSMDNTHCTISHVFMGHDDDNSAGITEYKLKKDKETDICFNLETFLKLLSKLDKKEPFTMKYKEKACKLTIYQKSQRGRTCTYAFNLLAVDIEDCIPTALDLRANVCLNALELTDVLNKFLFFHDVVRICTGKKNIKFLTQSEVTGTGKEVFPLRTKKKKKDGEDSDDDDDEPMDNFGVGKIKKPYEQYFMIPFLLKFMKASKVTRQVEVKMNDGPLCLEFGLENKDFAHFYLAPKDMDDEDYMLKDLPDADVDGDGDRKQPGLILD